MSSRRRRRGSAIAEFGPALFLLLIIIFFPMLDLMQMTVAYIFSGIYHDYMIRELAVSYPSPSAPALGASPDPSIQSTTAAKTKIDNDFKATGFYNFLQQPTLTVNYVRYVPGINGNMTLQVQTTCNVKPFLNIPFWVNVPGINANYNIVISSERPQEELGKN